MHVGDSDVRGGHSFPDLNPNPVFETGLDGKVVYSNPAAKAAFGQFETQPWLRDMVKEHVDGKMDKTTFTVKVDTCRWFQFTMLLEEKLRLIRFYGMNITELKSAEEEIQREREELRETESRFRSVLDSSVDCIYRLNLRTGRFEYISPSALRVVGLSPDELLQQGQEAAMGMIHPGDVAAMRAAIARAEVTGEEVVEYRQRTLRGDYRWISNHLSLIRDDQGHPLYRDGIIRDITERKMAEEALERNEVSLAQAQRIGKIGSWEWNIQTGELRWSAQLFAIYGVSPGAFVPTMDSFGAFIHPDDRAGVTEMVNQIMSAGKSVSFDFRIISTDGTTRVLNTVGEVIEVDENGRPLIMAGVNQDITERKRLEDSLKSVNERLETQVRVRTGQLEKSVRLYRMLSECNQALVTAADEKELIHRLCRYVVEEGGYKMAWVGYAQNDSEKSVRPVANVGFEDGYLEQAGITWADVERGRGPTGTAIREHRVCVGRDFLDDPALAPWREGALKRGFRSSLAVPLQDPDQAPFGALTIYSATPSAFGEDEIALFKELAADMAYGLQALRTQIQKEKHVRFYRTLSQCNQALVAAVDEEDLMRRICGIVVKEGGYSTSWVGYAEQDEARSIRPIASAGIDMESLKEFGFVWADVEKGQGPTGTAIRENRTIAWILPQRPFVLLEDEALRSLHSFLAFPLSEPGGAPFGALTVASGQERDFNDDELSLFAELANDLSFGIQALRARAQRNEALKTLEIGNRQLHRLTAQLTLAEQKERRQLAGVLHDDLQQRLVGAQLELQRFEEEAAKHCQDTLESCLQITRSLTTELCPSVLYKGNLVAVMDWLTKWAKDKYRLSIRLTSDRDQVKMPEDLTVMIYRSVQELLLNIAKHAHTREGNIDVACTGSLVQIRVSDKGNGFEPSAVQKDSVEGGFGLFAVQERLQNRGCSLSIQSSPGEGSVFTIAAPLAELADIPVARRESAGTRIKVLVVDDHSVIRQALATMLNMADDMVVVGQAENGREALDYGRRYSPDIVLMDIEMPELDGIKATRLLRLEHPHIKVIGLSMHDRNEVERDILDAGASAFLMKNAPAAELMQAIRGIFALTRD
jgi:PAS domain S-box-containing protein